ncbi:MFS transporter [Dellaglioa sp. P0083]|uniref:MFS transporter n=1 Tax=Dellaglioa kimchii TaxID=3344667 RepID=UPI0038D42100
MKKVVNYLKNNSVVFITIFTVSLFLVLPQILNKSLVLGGDSNFHFNRIYDTYMQLRTGNFNYFQTNFGFQQSGRIINALYGPGFSYILGLLLVIVHSWFIFQVVTSFIIFFVSGYSMYLLSRELETPKNISLMTSILFMSSFWITRWAYNQNFMTWGIMLMPLVIIFCLRMINNNGINLKVLPLALTISLLIQIHVLSALMSILVLIIFFIVGMILSTKKIQLLLKCLLAGFLTLVLTFNVWGALIDVYTSNSLYAPFSFKDMSNYTMNISTGTYDIGHMGLFMSVLLVLQIAFVFIYYKKMPISEKMLTFVGLIFLVFTSNLIPWTKLASAVPPLQSFLQFPNRFAGLATILLITGFGSSLSKLSSKDLQNMLKLTMLVSCVFILVQSYSDLQKRNETWNSNQSIVSMHSIDILNKSSNNQIKMAFHSPDLIAGLRISVKPVPDYLPKYGDELGNTYAAYSRDIVHNKANITKHVKNGTLVISWSAKNKEEKIHLPVVIYSNTVLSLNSHRLSKNKLELSTMGTPTIISTKSGENTLIVNYHSEIITKWHLIFVIFAWIISILSLVTIHFISNKQAKNSTHK